MGWNSWDCYGTTVTEAEVLANARFLHEHLLAHGWDTVVVDIAWYDPTARSHGYNAGAPLTLDAYGRQLPAMNRFPSAAGGLGFGPLAAAVHALGLRFGVHLLRGIPRLAVDQALPVEGTAWTAADAADRTSTCAWNPDNYGLDHDHPAAQAYLDGQVAQLAAWGVDLVKVDDILAPYHDRAIEGWARAIERSGREITLSLSPGTGLSTARTEHLRAHAQMWRVSDDLWDRWPDVHAQFTRLARWAPHQRPGGWADADMLPLGRIGIRAERGDDRQSRLTLDEQRTLLTLWVMARSPLMVGGDLPTSSRATIDLLATPAVGHVLRTSTHGQEALREALPADAGGGDERDGATAGELIVWTARAGDDDAIRYAAIFSTAAAAVRVRVPLTAVVERPTDPGAVRDLWDSRAEIDVDAGALVLDVPAHGVRWLALRLGA
ncbi:glycoside hydrolase family 27 protein [Pengzhenrongella sicca]|uniref:Alpha-galactosidase n=1 Tax=Pengzhenrongella sicca TaxID=2819238 RepID=A0A8A4ZM88_9MICO|nr:glycoside hydrolase family 27 protein [Pengzhenrongella sicca]QTE31637.1 glycoside hydrolase family 27 protein [Pengzhenrongella sicca]